MVAELFLSRGQAMPGDVRFGCKHGQPNFEALVGDQVGLLRLRHTQGNICLALSQIGPLEIRANLDVQPRISCLDSRLERQQRAS